MKLSTLIEVNIKNMYSVYTKTKLTGRNYADILLSLFPESFCKQHTSKFILWQNTFFLDKCHGQHRMPGVCNMFKALPKTHLHKNRGREEKYSWL